MSHHQWNIPWTKGENCIFAFIFICEISAWFYTAEGTKLQHIFFHPLSRHTNSLGMLFTNLNVNFWDLCLTKFFLTDDLNKSAHSIFTNSVVFLWNFNIYLCSLNFNSLLNDLIELLAASLNSIADTWNEESQVEMTSFYVELRRHNPKLVTFLNSFIMSTTNTILLTSLIFGAAQKLACKNYNGVLRMWKMLFTWLLMWTEITTWKLLKESGSGFINIPKVWVTCAEQKAGQYRIDK